MSLVINYTFRSFASHLKTIKSLRPLHRTFLSNAYYCKEVWDKRLNSSLLQKVNLDEFYHELESEYQRNKNISAVDVDIFTNAVNNDGYTDEILDLVHKLRLSANTYKIHDSTMHSVIRYLMETGEYDRMLQILDDRLNYGIFLDHYTANLLLDTCWKNKDYVTGARIAGQLMLQEDFEHPLNLYLSLLHCYKFLRLSEDEKKLWTAPTPPEEPEEEVKVRVKYIRNPFFDDHFDLKEPLQIVGKTLWLAGRESNDALGRTFQIIGLELYGKHDQAKALAEKFKTNGEKIIEDEFIFTLLPESSELLPLIKTLSSESGDIEKLLTAEVVKAERKCTEKDVADQCTMFQEWEEKRLRELEIQRERYSIRNRLENVEELKKKIKEKEQKLW